MTNGQTSSSSSEIQLYINNIRGTVCSLSKFDSYLNWRDIFFELAFVTDLISRRQGAVNSDFAGVT